MSHHAFFFAMLKAEHRALYKLNMFSTTELHTQLLILLVNVFLIGSLDK